MRSFNLEKILVVRFSVEVSNYPFSQKDVGTESNNRNVEV